MSEQETSELRERITAALRERHATQSVIVYADAVEEPMPWDAGVEVDEGRVETCVVSQATEFDGLRALAVAVGLDPDGSDPRAEVATLRAAALADAGRLAAERDAALAIIAGRDVAPTDAEVEAHERANGLGSAWLCVWEGRQRVIEHSSGVRYIRGTGGRPWWPLDATGRPCAWPTVTT